MELQSMRNNLRQLPALNFSRKTAGNLRGWDLTVRKEWETALMPISQGLVCVSVGHKILREGMKIKLGDTT